MAMAQTTSGATLAGGATTTRPATDETRVLRLTRRFAAPRGVVFRAFAEPEQLVRWWGPRGYTTPRCDIDLREGGAYRTTMRSPEGNENTLSGVYREVSPPARLVFTWAWESDGERGHETLVTLELDEVAGGTELRLTQEVFQTEEWRDKHAGGWTGCLDCLAEALADGTIA